MEEFLLKFHFLRPWWLLLLLLPLFFYIKSLRGRTNKSSWEKVCDKRLLDYLLIKGSSAQRKIMSWLALIGMVSAIVAAAGPSWKKIELPSLTPENPLMILLNMSSDMKEKDLTPNRLSRAKYKIKDLLETIKGAQAGLEVYSKEPFVISPLTEDSEIIINLLPAVNLDVMPRNGDRLDRAIDLAVEKFKNAGFIQGEIAIFAPDAGERFDLALDAAQRAKAQNYHVNIIATTTTPSERLQLIAQKGGGDYLALGANDTEIKALAAKINKSQGILKESKNWQSIWLDYGYYLLALPLLCCLYFFRRGILVITLIVSATPAQAGFFLNNNQEGLKLFNNGEYEQAGNRFEDVRWRGASLYKNGNFEAAYQEFAKGSDITALYNQGNALAKSGKIKEAISKYEEVLKLNPQHEDAKFNLEYLKQQQQQQNQPQNNQDQNQDKDKDEQQSSSKQDQQQNGDENKEQNQDQKQENQSQNDENLTQQNQSQPQNSQQGEQEPQPQETPEPNEEQPQNQSQNSNNEQKAAEEQQEQNQPRSQGGALQKEEEAPKYDEEVQAKAQQYREIPEDPGGLLKAFILKEYQQNRYNEQ